MKIEFIKTPLMAKKSESLQIVLPLENDVYPHEHLNDCINTARLTHAALCTAPFEHNGTIAMAYVDEQSVQIQSACFLPNSMKQYIAASEVTVFSTPYGQIALACGLDSLQPQYTRSAALRGCQLLICGLWLCGNNYFMAGPWSSAQANCLAVAVAQPTQGQLVLPCALTKDESGLGRGDFSLKEISKAYVQFPIFDCMNFALYEKYKEELLR